MKSFISLSQGVNYHLALETFLVKHSKDDFLFLWCSKPCVVIGKHQNPYKEINLSVLLKKDIMLARRISGGGAVYQDLGNINFTIIKNVEEGKQINFQEHSKPIFNALKNMGFKVSLSKRNDIIIEGSKISGNAEHVYKNRILHHGTLLFNSNLEMLESVLNSDRYNYKDQAIASVRSSVDNLKNHSRRWIGTSSFMLALFKEITSADSSYKPFSISDDINQSVIKLKKEKFLTDSWVWGHIPKYTVQLDFVFRDQSVSMKIVVKKGVVDSVSYAYAPFEVRCWLSDCLLGEIHTYNNFCKIFYPNYFSKEQIIQNFF